MIFEHLENIDQYIKDNKSFAIWKEENSEIINFILQDTSKNTIFEEIDKIDNPKGFIIAPFANDKATPIILIHPDQEVKGTIKQFSSYFKDRINSAITKKACKKEGFEHYSSDFKKFMELLEKDELEKIVLSRECKVTRSEDFSPCEAFLKGIEKYPDSYVYLCHTPISGTWMGCTPEILVKGNDEKLQTVALAGTLRIDTGESLPEKWNDKNRKEQRIVANYIKNSLSKLDIDDVTEEGPYVVKAGSLAHLKSDFYFSYPNALKIGKLINELHPTPAVCGFPKRKAYKNILEKESYDRTYYSGFVGDMNFNNRINLHVNLRCMRIGLKSLHLFAGGGLLPKSILNEEWEETVSKLETIQKLI